MNLDRYTPSRRAPPDVLVVGAGISGIGAGYHLQTMCPDRTYAILDGRDDMGGTWDLFRHQARHVMSWVGTFRPVSAL